MKRKLIFALLALSAVASMAHADPPAGLSFTGNLMPNQPLLAVSTSPVLDTEYLGIKSLSVQATISSATIAAQTFTDGTKSTGTLTVVSTTNLHGVIASDTITVAKDSALSPSTANNTVYFYYSSTSDIHGAYVSLNGKKYYADKDWPVADVSSNTAVNFAASVNADKMSPFTAAVASVAGSTVTLTSISSGSLMNSYTLMTSSPTGYLVRGSANFSGGLDYAYFDLYGRRFTAGSDFAVSVTTATTVLNIAAAVNAANYLGITASTTSATALAIYAPSMGSVYNALTLSASNTNYLTLGGALFTGGVNPAVVRVGAFTFVEGSTWTAVLTASGTAKAISDGMMSVAGFKALYTTTWTASGVVYATSTATGVSTNQALDSYPYASLAWGNGAMYGGTNSAVKTASSILNIPAHGFTNGLQVLFATSAGTAPGTLVTGTTYYVSVVDANNIRLATTSAYAVAGTPYVAVTTQTTLGGGSFTATPLTFAGTWGFYWSGSNDGTNWSDLTSSSISSFTYTSATAPTTYLWNNGPIDLHYLKGVFTSGSAGAASFNLTYHGRN